MSRSPPSAINPWVRASVRRPRALSRPLVAATLLLCHPLLRKIDDLPRCPDDMIDDSLQIASAHWLDVDPAGARIGQEIFIGHRGVEGGSQRRNPVGRNIR